MERRWRIWVGYDSSEPEAFAVAVASIRRHLTDQVPVCGLHMDRLRRAGMYTRPHEVRAGQMWDCISGAPMSTEFALTRFLVPHLSRQLGDELALFVDCDVLARDDMSEVFRQSTHPVMCVKHVAQPVAVSKMDGRAQTYYPRKLWSSLMLFQCRHQAMRRLTPLEVNTWRGLDLHQMEWAADDEIGALDPSWNYIPGLTQGVTEPRLVHFTEGGPWHRGYEYVEYADEWRREREGCDASCV
jgi:hypothetical protein